MFVVAQLSDTHFDLTDAATDRASRVMDYLWRSTAPIDAIIATGDIADHGLPAEYEQAAKAFTGPLPVLVMPGNHDVRPAYREALLGEPASTGPINRVLRTERAVYVGCDSSVPGRDEGLLDDETIGWLDETLGTTPAGLPVFVAFHHPPAVLHHPYVDSIRQLGENRLADVVSRHPHVTALICGHAHMATATTFAGRPLLVAPGVRSTVRLAWEGGDLLDYDQPPGVALHVYDEGTLLTHYRFVL